MFNLGMGLRLVGTFVRFVGGFVLCGLLIAGVYTLVVESVAIGLMMIGGALVGAWILNLVSGVLMVSGAAIGASSIERGMDQNYRRNPERGHQNVEDITSTLEHAANVAARARHDLNWDRLRT
jgi:hypothetical protein